ncbi:hypothetical protein ZHAS_00022241 [Anopheles sinensis]|uniref:Uncharacterized protein n=1 Tax=Anopheles sinensis TaxID=74873 RepID=A0A084WUU5_ANOSI|nr:hypothetical protein ZHAS_00022241 [Anopheles sinensis]
MSLPGRVPAAPETKPGYERRITSLTLVGVETFVKCKSFAFHHNHSYHQREHHHVLHEGGSLPSHHQGPETFRPELSVCQPAVRSDEKWSQKLDLSDGELASCKDRGKRLGYNVTVFFFDTPIPSTLLECANGQVWVL